MNNQNDKQIDDIVNAIDSLMSKGGGRVNVKVDDIEQELKVKTTNSTECSIANGACAQPTELEVEDK